MASPPSTLTDNHPEDARSGKIGLQLHAGPPMKVEFRNLLLRKLEGDEARQTLKTAIDSGESKAQVESAGRETCGGRTSSRQEQKLAEGRNSSPLDLGKRQN